MARYGLDYGRDYDAWGASQWGRGPRPYDSGYLGGRDGYGYEEWGESPLPRQPRRGGFGGGWAGAQQDPYGGFSGEGYRTYQRGYGSDYGFAPYAEQPGGAREGYRSSGRGGYGGGYQGGYEGGYAGGYGAGQWRSGRQSGGASRARASEIMTENPEAVTPDVSISEVAARMKELNVGIIPVVDSMENRRLRGVITDRDIAVRAVAEGKDGKVKVSDCMTSEVESVNKNDGVDRVLNLMERAQVRRVPVTDREGRLVGIIAQADLAVDYGHRGHQAEHMVQHALERISEPARPDRAGAAMQAGSREGSSGGAKQERSGKNR